MVKDNDLIFDLDDVGLVINSDKARVFSKREVSILTPDDKFPIFVKVNSPVFIGSATTIISTKVSLEDRLKLMYDTFVSMSIEEFYVNIVNIESRIKLKDSVFYINIESPIVSSQRLLEYVKTAKKQFSKQLVLMVGNVISPIIYKELKSYGVDYIRIGSDSTLNKKLGFYPGYGSLFDAIGIHEEHKTEERGGRIPAGLDPDIIEESSTITTDTKVVFEGCGLESIDRIIKAFAFGVNSICIKEEALDNIPEIVDALEEALYISNSKNLEEFKSIGIYMISASVLKA